MQDTATTTTDLKVPDPVSEDVNDVQVSVWTAVKDTTLVDEVEQLIACKLQSTVLLSVCLSVPHLAYLHTRMNSCL